ncbi:MAG TPA: ABC transporter substrate-binding protein [Candidatus Binatia bacterium]|nr:ABC transporter substrate-binding protein [Candidatus Binatia bacterium]
MGVPNLWLPCHIVTPILTFPRRGGRNNSKRAAKTQISIILILAFNFLITSKIYANPFLPKPGEAPLAARVGTCSITGGFIHFYSALYNGLFDKYGVKVEHVTLRGGVVSLAALSSDEIQFIYCSADPMIPRMAAGADAKLIGSPIVGLPWVLVGRKEIRRPEDLKGKSIALSRPGGLTDQLAKAVMKKFNLTTQDVKLIHIGGTGQIEPYNAMVQGLTQATFLTPPLDVRARRDGFSLIYNLNELGAPAIYSSMFTNAKGLKERPMLVQKFVAALAESVHFLEMNPEKGKAALSKVLSINDQEVLQSAYDAYAKALVNRRLIVPAQAVAQAVETAREEGTQIRRKPAEIIDNSFAEQLQKSGFLKELWGSDLQQRERKS